MQRIEPPCHVEELSEADQQSVANRIAKSFEVANLAPHSLPVLDLPEAKTHLLLGRHWVGLTLGRRASTITSGAEGWRRDEVGGRFSLTQFSPLGFGDAAGGERLKTA